MITGICAVGTYYPIWFPYTIASIYNIVDEIVVVNGGIDLKQKNPNPEELVPLEQVTKDIERLDIDNKIVEVRHDEVEVEHKMLLTTQYEANLKKLAHWYDLRGLNLTLANEVAVKRGAKFILKIDSDQVVYRDAMGLRNERKALILYQYEFAGPVGHPKINFLVDPLPDSPFNDSCFIYPARKDQFYGGGGAPALGVVREPTDRYHCAHLRYAYPYWMQREEALKHFYERMWFVYYTNEGLWGEELEEKARRAAEDLLRRKKKLTSVKPPEVVCKQLSI